VKRSNVPIFLFVLIGFSCTNKSSEKKLFTQMDKTGIDFTNTVTDTKELNIINYRNFYNGGGVGIGYSLHAGQVSVADGTDEAAKRLP